MLCLLLAAALAVLGHAAASAQVDDPAVATIGERLYRRDCASCHGPDGEGTWRGVPLQDAGGASADFYLSTGRMPIDEPDETIARSEPAYDEAEIDALVAYVASFGDGPSIPDVSGDGDLARGGSLYRLHCAQCHGASGVGVALAADVTAPSVLQSTPTQVIEALVVGPGAMPVFRDAVLDEDEREDVASYVTHLRTAGSEGGHPMARSGRLDEMLAGLGVGVVLMVAAARTIARRR